MKPRRHVIGGFVLLVAAVLLVAGEWSVLDTYVLAPLAGGLFVAGLANIVLGVGRPAAVVDRLDEIEAGTALLFAALALAIVIENALAPDGTHSYALAVLWGVVGAFTGWYGVDRLRTGGGSDDRTT